MYWICLNKEELKLIIQLLWDEYDWLVEIGKPTEEVDKLRIRLEFIQRTEQPK